MDAIVNVIEINPVDFNKILAAEDGPIDMLKYDYRGREVTEITDPPYAGVYYISPDTQERN